jgi:hypothetical protein
MISEPSLESILQRSPYKNIRKEAYDFIEDQVQSISSPFQRNILEGSLNQFIRDIEQNGTLLYIGSFIPTLLTSSIRPIIPLPCSQLLIKWHSVYIFKFDHCLVFVIRWGDAGG